MEHYEFHPLCTLLPEPTAQEFADLKSDILQNGLLDEIVLKDGKILDGRSRYNACKELGIEATFVDFDTLGGNSTPIQFVISKNLKRRHLSTAQRGATAAQLATMEGGMTKAEAAKAMNVSEGTVARTKRVLGNAIPEVQQEVASGEIPVAAAERIAKKPTTEQKAALAAEKAKITADRQKASDMKKSQAKTQAAATSTDKAIQTYTDCGKLCDQGQYNGKKLRKDIAQLQKAVDDLAHIDTVLSDLVESGIAFNNLGVAIDVLEKHAGVPVDTLRKNRLTKQNLYEASSQKLFAMQNFITTFPQIAESLLTACSTEDEQTLVKDVQTKFVGQKKNVEKAIAAKQTQKLEVLAKGETVLPAEWFTPQTS